MADTNNKNNPYELLLWYANADILSVEDCIALGEGAAMNKVLNKIHKYKIYETSDGRWRTYITDANKPEGRRPIVKKSKTELTRFLLNHYKCDMSYTMKSLWSEFEAYRVSMMKANTVKEDIKAFKKYYENDPISSKDLASISAVDLEQWLATIIIKYHMGIHAYSKMKTPLSQLYKWAKRKKYVDYNPFDDIDTNKLPLFDEKKKTGNQKAFVKGEREAIIKAAMDDFKKKPYPVPLAIVFTFLTGMRVSEVVALKWEDIDWECNKILVCRYEEDVVDFSGTYDGFSHYHYVIYECDTKGEYGPRDVYLTSDAIFILNLLKNYYKENNISTEWLFYSARQKDKIHDRALDLRLEKYCKQIGIPRKSMHKIRATYVSLLRDAGLTFESIAEQVGHKSTDTTRKNYSFDLKSEKENQRMIVTALGTGLVSKSFQN